MHRRVTSCILVCVTQYQSTAAPALPVDEAYRQVAADARAAGAEISVSTLRGRALRSAAAPNSELERLRRELRGMTELEILAAREIPDTPARARFVAIRRARSDVLPQSAHPSAAKPAQSKAAPKKPPTAKSVPAPAEPHPTPVKAQPAATRETLCSPAK